MMMNFFKVSILIFAIILALVPRALAVSWDDATPPPPGDPDYAAGIEAFKRENWKEVIRRMTLVVKERPWHDDAHNQMGFAFRKLKNYSKALEHYKKALELNPYHRGAMEYLGETYFEMGKLSLARQMLTRLETVCRRAKSARGKDDWKSKCEEWRDLKAAIDTYLPPRN